MNYPKVLLAVSALLASINVQAQAPRCPDDAMLEKLLAFGDLFLGEIHGTAEIPQLVQCLVNKALADSGERLIVSLEMPAEAREPTSAFWHHDNGEDGRSSQAMFTLVMGLVEKESQALLNLHFQYRARLNVEGAANRPRFIGLELQALSERGLLIALAGNAHSMKTLPPDSGLLGLQEGQYVGPNLTHINISVVEGGTHWACAGRCGVHELIRQAAADVTPGSLVDGAAWGHDYIYYLEASKVTASPPMAVVSQ